MSAPRILLDAPLTFDAGDGQTHAPMVHAAVHGAATKLIVDTGSSHHILTVELAAEVGLEATAGEPGIDSTGAAVPSWTLGEVSISIAGHPFALQDVVAITAPPPFPGWGIGGILSPQKLQPTAWAVIDLADDRLVLLDGDEAEALAWITARAPALRPLRLDRVPGDGTALVRAAIAPNDSVVTLLDSGGKRTRFTTTAVPDAEGGAVRSAGRGVGGAESLGMEVRNRTLRVGEAAVALETLVVGDELNGRDGLIGMDVLRGTVITVSGEASRPIFWQI